MTTPTIDALRDLALYAPTPENAAILRDLAEKIELELIRERTRVAMMESRLNELSELVDEATPIIREIAEEDYWDTFVSRISVAKEWLERKRSCS